MVGAAALAASPGMGTKSQKIDCRCINSALALLLLLEAVVACG
jgi:hypothetical protein